MAKGAPIFSKESTNKKSDNIFDSLIDEKIKEIFDSKMSELYSNYREQLTLLLESVIERFRNDVIDERCKDLISVEAKKRFDRDLEVYESLCNRVVKSNAANSDLVTQMFLPRIERIEEALIKNGFMQK